MSYQPFSARVVALCLLLIGVEQAVADAPSDMLRQMNRAFAELSYDGFFSYFSGGELASLRVVHKLVDGVPHERLVHLNGDPREIIRQGEDVACIVHPGDELAGFDKNIPVGPFARAFIRQFDQLPATYSVDTYGEDRIAGRVAMRLAVSPRDHHRYGYRLWLDKESKLLLRSELVDHNGNKLEIFQFTQVSVGDVDASALNPTDMEGLTVSHLRLEDAPKAIDTADSGSEDKAPKWSTEWVPEGFSVTNSDARPDRSNHHMVNTMMYSDGLAAFSVFIEPMPESRAAKIESQNGATLALTHWIADDTEEYLVTLVGEIPKPTAEQIVRSIRRN